MAKLASKRQAIHAFLALTLTPLQIVRAGLAPHRFVAYPTPVDFIQQRAQNEAMKLVTGTQMKALDQLVIERAGVPSSVLMENAGRQVVHALADRFPNLRRQRVVIVAGKGNNGGDGLVAARALSERGVAIEVLLLATPRQCSPETVAQLRLLGQYAPVVPVPNLDELNRLEAALQRADIVIDALLGIGVRGAVKGLYARAIEHINAAPAFCVALDVPSGVDADTGQVNGCAVQADLTVTLGLPKTGLLLHPGRGCAGELQVVSIGYPPLQVEAFPSPWTWLLAPWVRAHLPPRSAYSHKGLFGSGLLLAGSQGMSGALCLAAGAALRCGVGLLHLAYPRSLDAMMSGIALEAIKHPLPQRLGSVGGTAAPTILPLLGSNEAVALGPGLSQRPHTQALIRTLIPRIEAPLVIDADGLNALQGHLQLLRKRRAGATVLTPHPGEFARLTGLSVPEIEADRLGTALRFAVKYRVVLALKGVPTVVAAPNGSGYVNSTGNSGLAKGGSGDVLTGILLALLAQGLDGATAACCAVWIHGRAADLLQPTLGERSMLPSDVIESLPDVFRELEGPGIDPAPVTRFA